MSHMKRTWVGYGLPRDWMDREQGEGHEFLHEATQVKNIWAPTGEWIYEYNFAIEMDRSLL